MMQFAMQFATLCFGICLTFAYVDIPHVWIGVVATFVATLVAAHVAGKRANERPEHSRN